MSPDETGGGMHYHYNREERLARRPDRWQPSGGVFKRNRSLTIILLDVLIVVILFAIFRIFIFGDGGPPELRGYTVALDVLNTSQGVLAVVTLDAGADPEESSGIVTVRFRPVGATRNGASPGTSSEDRAGGEAVEVKDLLPEPGERRRISELLPSETTSVTATIEIDEDSLELQASVESEGDRS
ncbi:MAG: hypothetical protein ACOCYC_03980 [bacterium]